MILDTCFCVDLMRENQKKQDGPAVKKLKELGDVPVFMSVFVMCELQAGVCLSNDPEQELKKVELFAEYVDILYPDRAFSAVYGETLARCRKNGIAVSTMDLLIGVSAKCVSMPVLTRNVRDFEKIPDLVVIGY